jgi:hypothetical protein
VVGGGQTRCEGFARGCGRLTIPPKEPANEETDVQEHAHDRRRGAQTRARPLQKLSQRNAGARARQIDGPNVMKRHISKKVVNP